MGIVLVFPVCYYQVEIQVPQVKRMQGDRHSSLTWTIEHLWVIQLQGSAPAQYQSTSAVVWCWVAGVARRRLNIRPYGPKKHHNPLIPHHQTRTLIKLN